MDQELSPYCAVYTSAVEIIGRRWTGSIVRALLAGRCRFSAIAQAVPGLSDRLLSQRLKELEDIGVLVRTVTPSTPVCIEYTLTPMGRALEPVIATIEAWANDWLLPMGEPAKR